MSYWPERRPIIILTTSIRHRRIDANNNDIDIDIDIDMIIKREQGVK